MGMYGLERWRREGESKWGGGQTIEVKRFQYLVNWYHSLCLYVQGIMEVHFQLLLKWMRKGSRAIHRPLLGEKIDKIGYDKNK